MSCGIYKFENNINHMIYIGQSIDLETRYKKHYFNIKDKNHQEDLYVAFRLYGFENFSYTILEEFQNYNVDKLNELEIYYIKKYNSLKPNGYNMTPGGNSGNGLLKGKIVQQFDLYGNFIAEYLSAHQADYKTGIDFGSICACCREEITHTKNFQWKYKDSNKEIKDISKETILKDKKVFQYSLKGELLYIYKTLNEAAEKTNISKSLICKACKKKGLTAGGFIWRYENDLLKKNEKINLKEKPVGQYDKNNNLIKIYKSISEAAKETNTNAGNLQQVCKGKRKTANNYIWKYLE